MAKDIEGLYIFILYQTLVFFGGIGSNLVSDQ